MAVPFIVVARLPLLTTYFALSHRRISHHQSRPWSLLYPLRPAPFPTSTRIALIPLEIHLCLYSKPHALHLFRTFD